MLIAESSPWCPARADPLDSSWVAARAGAPAGAEDPQLTIVHYDRTEEENAHFGLTGAARGSAAPIA